MSNLVQVKKILSAGEMVLAEGAAHGADPKKMQAIAVAAIGRDTNLQRCEPVALAQAIAQSMQLGLNIGLSGEAYLVPYGRRAQLIIGYRGLVKLARQSGSIVDVRAFEVRENDDLSVTYDGPRVNFSFAPAGEGNPFAKRGDVVGYCAVAYWVNGHITVETMTPEDIDTIRRAAKSGNSGPWKSHYSEMAKKTVLRRMCKSLPMSSDVTEALGRLDAEGFTFGETFHDKRKREAQEQGYSFDAVFSDDSEEVVEVPFEDDVIEP